MGVKPLKTWKRWNDAGDSFELCMEFEATAGNADIRENFEAPDGAHCTHSYDCCGNFYPSQVKIQRGWGRGVLAVQRFNQNI